MALPREVTAALEEAEKSGHYLITVSYRDTAATELKVRDLRHYWKTQDYEKADFARTMDHLKQDLMEREGVVQGWV